MSWADILYKENPGRRQYLAELCGQLQAYIEMSFETTNTLIDIVEKCFQGQKFEKIFVKKTGSIGDNLNQVKERVQQIMKFIEERNALLQLQMGKDILQGLVSPNTSVPEVLATLRKWTGPTLAVVGTIAGIRLIIMITKGMVFVNLCQAIVKVGTSIFGCIGIALLGLAVDFIISAIVGSKEKKALLKAIDECEKTKAIWQPIVKEFNEQVIRMKITLEL